MTSCDLAITVEQERRAEITAIAGSPRSVGGIIRPIGPISGRDDATCLAAAPGVAGVARVRATVGIQLPPFDPRVPR